MESHVVMGNETIKGQVYLTKFGDVTNSVITKCANPHMTFLSGDVKVTPIKPLTLSLAYFADVTTDDSANPL